MRTLETMIRDNLNYMENGGIRSDAQLFHNCISKPIFNIPVSQVRIGCKTATMVHVPLHALTFPFIGVLARSPYNSRCVHKDIQAI